MTSTLRKENRPFEPRSWETVPCPFCGSDDAYLLERYGTNHRFTHVRCRNCHLTYQNPRPTYDDDFVETAYAEYETSVAEIWEGDRPTPFGELVFARMGNILAEIEEILGRRGRILDIGCHIGYFSKVAVDRGWTVKAVDVSENMVELAKKEFGLDAVVGDWTELSLGDPFDVIYCSHVIEHIPNPVDWMRSFREKLVDDGLLVIEVPNMLSLDRRYKRLRKRLGLKKDRWAVWRTPDHLYEPCARSLIPFMEHHGFTVERYYTYSRKEKRGPFPDFYYRAMKWGSNLRVYARPTPRSR